MLDARCGFNTVVVEDTILLLGGRNGATVIDTVDEYHVISNTWRRLNWTLPLSSRSDLVSWYNSQNKLLYVAFGYISDATSQFKGNVYARRMTDDDSSEWMVVFDPYHRVDVGYDFSSTVVTC
jgi:hypothetical protein